MQGVIILALKKSAYSLGAFNLALSIKNFNPSIPITLISDGEHLNNYRLEHFHVFDTIKEIKKEDYTGINGVFEPGFAKLNIYKYSNYDGTLFVDADSLCLKDITPFLNSLKGSSFKGDDILDYGKWVSEEDHLKYFNQPYGVSINSSWFYWEDDAVFRRALEYYSLKIPIECITPSWGNAYPDELFFNLAINFLKKDVDVKENVMFFGKSIDHRSLTELEDTFYFFTLYGNRTTVRKMYVDWYDRILFRLCEKKGMEHYFKAHTILVNKHLSK